MPDGESGAPRFAIRYWSGQNWDEPNLVHIAHPGTIEQGNNPQDKPPVLAMSRASASGTEPTLEAILPEFRARWEIIRRHRED